MRGIASLAGLLLCLTFGSAAAQTTYRLQPGDILQVWIAGEPELTREVVLAPDGWLSFPLAGHFKGSGLSVSELETQLLDRLKTYFKESPNLTIMLRPNPQVQSLIYVTGEVARPGEYTYRPNMTVLHGLSVAGGLYRTALLAADQDRSVVVRRTIEQAQRSVEELKARITRLGAEMRGERTLGTPAALAADAALSREQSLLNSRLEARDTEERAQRQTNELSDRSVSALTEQIEAMSKRIDLARQRLQSISTLIARGGAEGSQQALQEGVVADLEGQSSRLASEKAVAERARLTELARQESVRQDRQTQLLVELNTSRRELEEATARLDDSSRIMSIYDENAAANAQRQGRVIVYHIVRSVNGETREFRAAETTPILPGDLLRVLYNDQETGPLDDNPNQQSAAPASTSSSSSSVQLTAVAR